MAAAGVASALPGEETPWPRRARVAPRPVQCRTGRRIGACFSRSLVHVLVAPTGFLRPRPRSQTSRRRPTTEARAGWCWSTGQLTAGFARCAKLVRRRDATDGRPWPRLWPIRSSSSPRYRFASGGGPAGSAGVRYPLPVFSRPTVSVFPSRAGKDGRPGIRALG